MRPTVVDQGSDPVDIGGGADGDVAITLDEFSLFRIDIFA